MNELLPKRTYFPVSLDSRKENPPKNKTYVLYTTFIRNFCSIKTIVRDNPVDKTESIPLQSAFYTGESKFQITESSREKYRRTGKKWNFVVWFWVIKKGHFTNLPLLLSLNLLQAFLRTIYLIHLCYIQVRSQYDAAKTLALVICLRDPRVVFKGALSRYQFDNFIKS